MRIRLALAGQRPINNLVDISNYVMLEVGQPTHFYDAAKIPDKRLIVRNARGGEQLVTLDGEQHELTAKDLVIASERGAEGFAGLMGGAASEVTDSTTGILMEAATFTGSRVRRTSARHGFRSEASTRHEKSLPTALAIAGARRAAELLAAQGANAGPLVVEGAQDEPSVIEFRVRDVKRLLGFTLSAEDVRELLDRLGFTAEAKDAQTLVVTSPPWRRDVTISADVVEEVARMAGYDRIEPAIPALAEHDVRSNQYELEQRIAHSLAALGYREIITYSLHGAQIHERMARAAVIPTFRPVEVLNPLSEDQRYLRSGFAGTHLQYFARIDAPIRIFEIGHIYYQDNGEPLETSMVIFGFSAEPLKEPEWRDTHFLRLKGDVEELLHALTGRRDFEFTADKRNGIHPGKTAAILLDGREIAFMGQMDPRLVAAFDVRFAVYGCAIFLERIPEYRSPLYRPPSKYPSTYRDLALVCEPDVTAASIERVIARAIGPLCTGVRAFDEYRGEQIAPDKKSLAVRVTLQKYDTTITDEEADAAMKPALDALHHELGATLRT
jgi:phenylalanyl-tRNA synthetase beta chain